MGKFRLISTELLPFNKCKKLDSVLYLAHFFSRLSSHVVYELIFSRSSLGL